MNLTDSIRKYLTEAMNIAADGAHTFAPDAIDVAPTADPSHGDYGSNAAFVLMSALGKAKAGSPRAAADLILAAAGDMPLPEGLEAPEIAGAGYINFRMTARQIAGSLDEVLAASERYGASTTGAGQHILLEFISANPTGPLTLANARGGFLGDALANILSFSGYEVTREYYMNDSAYHNTQIQNLGRSILATAGILPVEGEQQYSGEYIKEVTELVLKREPGLAKGKDIFLAGSLGAQIIFERYLTPTLAQMGITFDRFTREDDFYEDGSVQRAVEEWQQKGLVYEKDGALWFKVSADGESDAVIRRSSGEYTYLAADIVHYLKNLQAGEFAKLINYLGADHHGTAANLLTALKAFGYEQEIEIIIMQFVRLVAGGKEVKMSKRAGNFVTVDELLAEVGIDAARFFILSRSSDSHMDFDLDLAKEQSSKNPVYYVQYAHARLAGILKNAGEAQLQKPNWQLLDSPEEQTLIRELLKFPAVLAEITARHNTQILPHYLIKLADVFHPFYDSRRVLTDDVELTASRLALVTATKVVIGNGLALLGVSAPESM